MLIGLLRWIYNYLIHKFDINPDQIHPNKAEKLQFELQFRNGEVSDYDGFQEDQKSNAIVSDNTSYLKSSAMCVVKYVFKPVNLVWLVIFLILEIEFKGSDANQLEVYFLIPYILAFCYYIYKNIQKVYTTRQRDKIVNEQLTFVFDSWQNIRKKPTQATKYLMVQSSKSIYLNQHEEDMSRYRARSIKKIEEKRGIQIGPLKRMQSINQITHKTRKTIADKELEQLKSILQKSLDVSIVKTPMPSIQPSITPNKRGREQTFKFTQKDRQMAETKNVVDLCESRKWQDITVGDLIFLPQETRAPCDMIIIDSQVPTLFIDTSDVLGNTDLQLRYSIENTKTHSIDQTFHLKRMMTGLLAFDSTYNPSKFKGFLKLSKDPKGMDISKNNLILRQEKLASGNWVIGIAIQCGRNSYIHKSEITKRGFKANSFRPKSQTKKLFRAITLTVFIIQILVFFLLILISDSDMVYDLFLKDLAYMSFISPLFFQLVDKILTKILTLIQLRKVSIADKMVFLDKAWKIASKSLIVLDSNIFLQENLIISNLHTNQKIDKPTVYTDDDRMIEFNIKNSNHKQSPEQSIKMDMESEACDISESQERQGVAQKISQLTNSKRRFIQTLHSNDDQQKAVLIADYDKIDQDSKNLYVQQSHDGLLRDYQKTVCKQFDISQMSELKDSLLIMALCHRVETRYKKTKRYKEIILNAFDPIDHMQLKTVEETQYCKFLQETTDKYHQIQLAQKQYDFPCLKKVEIVSSKGPVLLAIFQYEADYKTTYLRNQPFDFQGVIYIREIDHQEDLVSSKKGITHHSIFQIWQSMGMRTISYYERKLLQDEIDHFQTQLTQIETLSHDSFLQMELYEQIKKHVDNTFSVSFKPNKQEKKEKVKQSFSNLSRSIDTDLWLLSSDRKQQALTLAINERILKYKWQINLIEGLSKNDLLEEFRNIFAFLMDAQPGQSKLGSLRSKRPPSLRQTDTSGSPRRRMPGSGKSIYNQNPFDEVSISSQNGKPKLQIMIDGDSWQIINEDSDLRNHLRFFLLYTRALVGYNMNHSQKTSLCQMLAKKNNSIQYDFAFIGRGYSTSKIVSNDFFSINLLSDNLTPQFHRAKVQRVTFFKRVIQSIKRRKMDYENAIGLTRGIGVIMMLEKDIELLKQYILQFWQFIYIIKHGILYILIQQIIFFSLTTIYLIVMNLAQAYTISDLFESNMYLQYGLFVTSIIILILNSIIKSGSSDKDFEQNGELKLALRKVNMYTMRYWLKYPSLLVLVIKPFLLGAGILLIQLFDRFGPTINTKYNIDDHIVTILMTCYQWTIIVPLVSRNYALISMGVYFILGFANLYDSRESFNQFMSDDPSHAYVLVSLILIMISIEFTATVFNNGLLNQQSLNRSDYQEIQRYHRLTNQENNSEEQIRKKFSKTLRRVFKLSWMMDVIQDYLQAVGHNLSQKQILYESDHTLNQLNLSILNDEQEQKSFYKHIIQDIILFVGYIIVLVTFQSQLYEIVIVIILGISTIVIDYQFHALFNEYYFTINYFKMLSLLLLGISCMFSFFPVGGIEPEIFFYICHMNLYQSSGARYYQFFGIIILAIFYISLLTTNQFFDNGEVVDAPAYASVILTLLIYICILIFFKHEILHLAQQKFFVSVDLTLKSKQISDLLAILLPQFIRARIDQQGQYDIVEDQGDVVIMFCDICEFDFIIQDLQDEVIKFLDTVFRQYDKLCAEYGVQKIETVGKTYMAAAGLKSCENSSHSNQMKPIRRITKLAKNMVLFANKQRWGQQKKQLKIKIGIHYGKAIAGVIGYHKPQFSLIGNTVNMTSRVCSTGLDGMVTLSEAAYEELGQSQIKFESRKVEMKGLGVQNTYIMILQTSSKKENQDTDLKWSPDNRFVKFSQNHSESKSINMNSVLGSKFESSMTSFENFNTSAQPVSKLKKSEYEYMPLQVVYNVRLEADYVLGYIEDKAKDEQPLLLDMQNLPKLLLLRKNHVSTIEKEIQDEFDRELRQQSLGWSRRISYSIMAQSLVGLIFSFYKRQVGLSSIILRLPQLLYLTLFTWLFQHKQYFFQGKFFLAPYCWSTVIIIYEISGLENEILTQIVLMELIVYFSLLSYVQVISTFHKLIIAAVQTILFIIELAWLGQSLFPIYIFSSISFLQILQSLNMTMTFMSFFNQKKKLKQKQEKESDLLMHLLPSHILGNFLNKQYNEYQLIDKIEGLTMLFADISGFTEYSSLTSPEQVMNMLKSVFVEFDKTCLLLKTYKLYTIGDCYVAIGMINIHERDPEEEAKNILDLAFCMVEIVQKVREVIQFPNLYMRIGIHTGDVIGGVMGTDIVRYDIYGKDVVIANKMESNGEKDRVQVSGKTKDLIVKNYPDQYYFVFNKRINIASIGEGIDGYFVEPADLDDGSPSA